MQGQDIVILRRDCEARMIPSGTKMLLPGGTEVVITQALGDSYTVNFYGNLWRIDGHDADALGKEVKTAVTFDPNASLEEQIFAQLKTCFDPEIPVNIVDLGLIYECHTETIAENQHHVSIKMTLTAPGCGMGPVLANDVKQKVLALPGIMDVNVEVVFDPPWNHSKMSEAAKLQLGML
ncbi:MAG: putative Fe-S cluster assembly protein SufT [Gammaproteobacteria bacterium]